MSCHRLLFLEAGGIQGQALSWELGCAGGRGQADMIDGLRGLAAAPSLHLLQSDQETPVSIECLEKENPHSSVLRRVGFPAG